MKLRENGKMSQKKNGGNVTKEVDKSIIIFYN